MKYLQLCNQISLFTHRWVFILLHLLSCQTDYGIRKSGLKNWILGHEASDRAKDIFNLVIILPVIIWWHIYFYTYMDCKRELLINDIFIYLCIYMLCIVCVCEVICNSNRYEWICNHSLIIMLCQVLLIVRCIWLLFW